MVDLRDSVMIATIAALLTVLLGRHDALAADAPRYFHVPTLEMMQGEVYLKQTEHFETVIANAPRGSDLHTGDYVTHADGIRVLNGGLAAFLKNGDLEAILPIVDEEDEQFGGQRLSGFVLVQVVHPRKLSTRRGEVVLDPEEGGPPPTLSLGHLVVAGGAVKSTSDPSYQPPPYGGGVCITARDCNGYNGTCAQGRCSCNGPGRRCRCIRCSPSR
ncbi:hypothetical protein EON64_21125 [archaeon]|nr:MAG: hypothetical protein EON64_21125 [archaeon]